MKDERLEIAYVLEGVSSNWLSQVFRRGRDTIKELLVGCPTVSTGANTIRRYDVAEAARYLVTPKLDLNAYIRSLKKADLPPNLQPVFWDTKLKRQKWEFKAGMLWPADSVMAAFTECFKTIRNTMALWVDDLERMNLTEAQRVALVAKVDELQASIYKMLIEDSKLRATRSQLADLDEIDAMVTVEDDEDDEPAAVPKRRRAPERIEDYI